MNRLALYWRCYGCQFAFTLYVPEDIGATCCPNCGFTLLLPTYGPTDPEDGYIPTAWSP